MAKIDLESITEAISDEQPCGPDLDMEFDMDFMNFIAEIEGMIPTRYFSFDPSTLKFDTYYDQIGDFLERTRDIRILVPLAKLRILQGDLTGFTDAVEAVHRLLKDRWADVHPQPTDFLELSMGQISTLDDMPNVVLPLQHTPIVRSRRAGAITLRKWQIAQGDVNPREGEDSTDTTTIMGALAESDADELNGVNETLGRARDAVAGIRLICIEEAGFDQAPAFEKLPEAIEAMIQLIESATGGASTAEGDDDSGAAAAGSGGTAMVVQLPAGAVANREEAVEALHAAAKYFALKEPSSPVPVLLREAQNATSKSFYELVNELVPDTAGSAFVSLGEEPWFDVSLYTLDSRNPPPDYESDSVDDTSSSWENAGLEDEIVAENDMADGSGNDATANDAAEYAENSEPVAENDAVENDVATANDAANDNVANDDAANDAVANDYAENDSAQNDAAGNDAVENDTSANDSVENDAATENDAIVQNDAASDWVEDSADTTQEVAEETGFVANSRPEAVALMEKVLAYYRVAEPSSPVPLILERAIDLSSKSFIELLGKVLPDGSLKVTPKEEGDGSW